MSTRPDSPATVVVTGGTGTVGRLLVHHLAGLGLRPRVLVRDGGRARALFGDDADIVVGSLAERPVVRAALTGASALFLACGNVPGQVELESAAIDAAGRAGVRRVVKLSARGADPAAGVAVWRDHAAIEQHLTASRLPAVILRPSFYMTNLLAAAEPVRRSGVLPAAAGTAPIAMIDPADIAAVAARALLGTAAGDDLAYTEVLELTGPEALTYDDVAERLSPVTGRPITYRPVTPGEAAAGMIAAGMPGPVTGQILEIFAVLRSGAYATTTDAVPRVTGRPAGGLVRRLRP